jgi:hypothetical protein
MNGNNQLRYVELITKPLIRGINNISHDVIKNNSKIRRALKSGTRRSKIPNEWIYHRFTKLSDYIRDQYDMYRLEN